MAATLFAFPPVRAAVPGNATVPAVALGNAVVAVPSERWPLAATDLYQVFDTSDVPGGVVNIVTGARDALAGVLAAAPLVQPLDDELTGAAARRAVAAHVLAAAVLAAHDDLDGLWYFAGREGSAAVERLSTGNLKRTWVSNGHARDWADPQQGEGEDFLREALQVKNIWTPFGE